MDPTASLGEFDNLPLAIRRKYFSTLERLRLAQDQAAPQRQKSFHIRKSSLGNNRLVKNGRAVYALSPRKLRKGSSVRKEYIITQADAQWFMGLPDTLRRKLFTQEEQVLLAGTGETVILDSADEAILKMGRQAHRNIDPADEDGEYMFDDSMDDLSEEEAAEDSEMTAVLRDSFRWIDEEDDLDTRLQLDDYHYILSKDAEASQPRVDDAVGPYCPRRPNPIPAFGRASSSSNIRRGSSGSIAFDHSKHKLSASSGNIGKDALAPIDPQAKYYQDPEARLKLRVYLASPQKFDEAIEFGFPSIDAPGKENRPTTRAKFENKTRPSQEDRTFLDDDQGSIIADADDTSDADSEQPATPSDTYAGVEPRFPSTSQPTSTDSAVLPKTMFRHRPSDSYAQGFAGSREMTLRMTLTRPDLRADESVLYGWQNNDKRDPLALEELPMTEDTTGMMGPFGGADGWSLHKRGSIMKKLWRRMKPAGIRA